MTYYGVCIANSLRSLDRLSAPRPRSNGAGHRVLGNGAGRGIRAGPRVLAGPLRPVTKTNQKGPEFKAGDLVMLDRRNLQTKRPMNKLDHKKMGPLPVF